MDTILNEAALPGARFAMIEYVRSRIDPRYLINCRTGDVYARADGLPWGWAGYRVTMNAVGDTSVEPWTARDDLARYDETGERVDDAAAKARELPPGHKPKPKRRRAA